jgi:hypothetical protein
MVKSQRRYNVWVFINGWWYSAARNAPAAQALRAAHNLNNIRHRRVVALVAGWKDNAILANRTDRHAARQAPEAPAVPPVCGGGVVVTTAE